MDRQTEERFQRLEAELAHASNNAFDVNSVHIALMIVIRAFAHQLPESDRSDALAAALARADADRGQGLAMMRTVGIAGKPLADFHALHDAVKRNIERMLGNGEA